MSRRNESPKVISESESTASKTGFGTSCSVIKNSEGKTNRVIIKYKDKIVKQDK
jgi:hypothetical protein